MSDLRCALAIGGLDPGGGAGLCADLRAFAAAGAFGCAAAALLTIQSTKGLVRARALPSHDVVEQALCVLAHQDVRAIKVGALGSAANVHAVGALLAKYRSIPAVIDTPMLPSRGKARLLAAQALGALRDELVPRAALLTVNVAEAAALVGIDVRGPSDAHDAAVALTKLGARAVLVKGGHLAGAHAVDVLAVGAGGRVAVTELRSKRIANVDAHGTGCTLASLVAGRLAARADWKRGDREGAILEATKWAKRVHHAALAKTARVGEGARVLVF